MSTLMEELTAIKAVEDKLTSNKVANFAYTDHAYNNPLTEADGVETYDVDAEQNIPVANASILKVNPTILTKGWRAQASAITRMLMNHFLGRCSYNLNKVNDLFSLLLTKFMAFLGSPNGIATLDANGRIPYSQLPESAVELKGYWNADTNTPSLADGTGTNGDEYIVEVAGTQDLGSGSQYFGVGDRVVYTGGVWKNISSGFVRTVNNIAPDAQGNVTSILGKSSLPITRNFISAMFGQYLGLYWQKASGIPTDAKTYAFGYGNHTWVACTDSGVYSSNNAVSWSKVSNLVAKSVWHAEGLWVIGASSGIYWSEDLENWTQAFEVTDSYIKVTYQANGIWLVGSDSNGHVYKSSNGKSWEQVTGLSTLLACKYVNGLWVAVAKDGIYWSEDNTVTWTKSLSYSFTYSITSTKVKYIRNTWRVVIRTTQGGLYTSIDGKNWTHTYTLRCGNIDYFNGVWAMATDDGVKFSLNGTSWSQASGIGNTDITPDIIALNGMWLTSSTVNTGLAFHSADGRSWESTSVRGLDSNNMIALLFYANGVLLGGGDNPNNGVYYSRIDDLANSDSFDFGAELTLVD